jgi:glyoxylase-like metal-dependent hydrolase (beta-lactamase superfamily II)
MDHMRVLRPAPGVYAFYDGRVDGYRFAEEPNWVDEGAISLGIASYAIVSEAQAIVYDTHVSVPHGRRIRETLEAEGAREFTVILSHWHLDHIAGTEAFEDCEVISSERTAELLAANQAAIEAGELEGPPGIDPLVLPTRTYGNRFELSLGSIPLQLIHTDIHSDDATVIWMPEQGILLCGDTMEDTVTYVDEPGSLETHLDNLAELRTLDAERILPNHGDPEVIAAGGYPIELIAATERYLEILRRSRSEPELRQMGLRELLAEDLEGGAIHYFPPYEAVHRENLEQMLSG